MTAYVLNLLDLAFTLYALQNGGVEANPLMQCVPFQIIYKVFAVGALCWWLSARQERMAKVGLGVCTAVFAAVDLWHITNLFLIGVCLV